VRLEVVDDRVDPGHLGRDPRLDVAEEVGPVGRRPAAQSLRILPVPRHMWSGSQATTRAKDGSAERLPVLVPTRRAVLSSDLAVLGGGLGLLLHSAAGRHPARLAPLTHLFNLHQSKGPASRGFVLRDCIRKADGACDEAALVDGLADTTFFRSALLNRRTEPAYCPPSRTLGIEAASRRMTEAPPWLKSTGRQGCPSPNGYLEVRYGHRQSRVAPSAQKDTLTSR
jgi:hypothetical protein